ncbi:hypothetical protein [uncultured Microbulbifer sp.]|uniref:hypothetical protein n=1 Tax=uncultured Microbulbifer sp. TaxID=348147 RepID=UPI0026159AF1|nr:hypothetical protein [uncultured Microbulbifer sp.]
MGNIGQELIFDIDLKINGLRFYDAGFHCYVYVEDTDLPFPSPKTIKYKLVDSGTPPNCVEIEIVGPGNEFHFSVSMNVACSGMAIGSNAANKNATLTLEEIGAIRDSIHEIYGVIGNPYDRKRELNLIVDGSLEAGERQCKTLSIYLSGFSDAEEYQIHEITSDIIIAQSF